MQGHTGQLLPREGHCNNTICFDSICKGIIEAVEEFFLFAKFFFKAPKVFFCSALSSEQGVAVQFYELMHAEKGAKH